MLTSDQLQQASQRMTAAPGGLPPPAYAPNPSGMTGPQLDSFVLGTAAPAAPKGPSIGQQIGNGLSGAGISDFGKNLGAQYAQAGQKIGSSVQQAGNNLAADDATGNNSLPAELGKAGHLVEGGLGTAAGAVQGIFAPLTAAMQTGADETHIHPVETLMKSPVGEKLGAWASAHPEAAQDLQDTFTVATAGLGEGATGTLGATDVGAAARSAGGALTSGASDAASAVAGGARTAADAVANAGKGTVDAVGNKLPIAHDLSADPATLDKQILTTHNKAIKPSVIGKTTGAQVDQYNRNVVSAYKAIAANKPNLNLLDEFGVETGKLPESVSELSQAVDQTKASIFGKYNALAKSAGEKGADVQLSPIAEELEKVSKQPTVQDLHPELANYAARRAEALRSRGAYDMEGAQKAVQSLNQSLDAFYRNPSYETASKASVDALIANNLRKGLDDAVDATTDTHPGAGYQELKNQYASLKAIEKDVNKRSVVLGRQGMNRGLNFGDVVSAEELVRGLTHLNPQAVMTSGAIKGIAALRSYLNDPNRAIKTLFGTMEKSGLSGGAGAPVP